MLQLLTNVLGVRQFVGDLSASALLSSLSSRLLDIPLRNLSLKNKLLAQVTGGKRSLASIQMGHLLTVLEIR